MKNLQDWLYFLFLLAFCIIFWYKYTENSSGWNKQQKKLESMSDWLALGIQWLTDKNSNDQAKQKMAIELEQLAHQQIGKHRRNPTCE